MRILVVEDDKLLAHLIRRSLTEEGYAVDAAYDGMEGESLAINIPYDLLILDIMLPKKDGFEVCRNLRQQKLSVPILMLTARDTIADKVKGLDEGADDYVVKPFDFIELSARIRTLLRRGHVPNNTLIVVGNISLNTLSHEVKRSEQVITLTSKEYCILEYFLFNPGILITRRMLEEHCWNLTLDSESNLIDAYILRLRRKMDLPGNQSFIETIRGAGYRLNLK